MSCGSKRCEDLGCFGMCDSALAFGYAMLPLAAGIERKRYNGNEDAARYARMETNFAKFEVTNDGLRWHAVPNRLRGAWINSEGDAV